MKVIEAEFWRLTKIPVTALVRAVGVYVIWDGKARKRPTYIGEGTILKRFAQHGTRFALPFDGYAAILGDEGERHAKRDAQIVEALLLEVAADTDRYPSQNAQRGKLSKIDRVFRKHGVLRVRVAGQDPLLIPGQSRRVKKTMRLEEMGERVWRLNHDWRLRRAPH